MNDKQKLDHYLELAEQMLDEAFCPQRQAWLQQVEAELPDIRQLLEHLATQQQDRDGLKLTYLLQELWFEEQHTAEGLKWLQRFLAKAETAESTPLRAMSLDLAGAFALNLNQLTLASNLKKQGIALHRQLGNQSQLGYALLHQGHLVGYGQDKPQEAEAIYREARGLFQQLADPLGIAHSEANLASQLLQQGNSSAAAALIERCLPTYVELNCEWDIALTLGIAAGVALDQKQVAKAVLLAAASAAHRQRIGVSLPDSFLRRFQQTEQHAQQQLPKPRFTTLWQRGQALSLSEATKIAMPPTDPNPSKI